MRYKDVAIQANLIISKTTHKGIWGLMIIQWQPPLLKG
jgi:hypothetical protein